MTIDLYVIKCEQNKYYIGKSSNLNNRILEHFQGNGSEWTKKYIPLEIIQIIKDVDHFDEDKYTKIYMAKYGIDNVRGGTYSQIYLDSNIKEHLEKEIYGANNKCFKCGKYGHFIKNCKKKTNINKKNDKCFKCGKFGHWSSQCYSSSVVVPKINIDNELNKPINWPLNKFIQIVSIIDNQVLDIDNKNYSQGALVTCYKNNEGNNQIWSIDKDGYIKSYLNDLVLDIFHHSNEIRLCTQIKKNVSSQKWKIVDQFIVNESNGLVITNIENNLVLMELNNTENQKWSFKFINPNLVNSAEKLLGTFYGFFAL